jgi:hypothetical protein
MPERCMNHWTTRLPPAGQIAAFIHCHADGLFHIDVLPALQASVYKACQWSGVEIQQHRRLVGQNLAKILRLGFVLCHADGLVQVRLITRPDGDDLDIVWRMAWESALPIRPMPMKAVLSRLLPRRPDLRVRRGQGSSQAAGGFQEGAAVVGRGILRHSGLHSIKAVCGRPPHAGRSAALEQSRMRRAKARRAIQRGRGS